MGFPMRIVLDPHSQHAERLNLKIIRSYVHFIFNIYYSTTKNVFTL